MGQPHRRYRNIHIAGTKGKGSVAAMLTSIMTAAKLKTGTYTSPHIVDVRERIALDGNPVKQDIFAKGVNAVRSVMGERPREYASFFEALTAAALWIFAQKHIDIAVIEAGLGGTYDATNIIQPDVAVLTRIGLDHTERLGNEITQIAADKAGIIKTNCKVVIGGQLPEALHPIFQRAKYKGVPIFHLGNEYKYRILHKNLTHTNVEIILPNVKIDVELPLAGGFQGENAATAAMTAFLMGISPECIFTGLQETVLHGRMELVSRKPNIILDGAHNPTAAATVSSESISLGIAPLTMIIAINSPKDYSNMLSSWARIAKLFIFTTTGSPRAYNPKILAAEAEHVLGTPAIVAKTPVKAIEIAKKITQNKGTILATGSIYLVGELLPLLANKK